MNVALKVIDTELALEHAGGSRELADELFGMLLKELPGYLQGIPQALREQRYHDLHEQVHKLAGSTNYTGVPALKQAAETLDRQLKQGIIENVHALVDTLLQEIERVRSSAE